LPGVYAELAAEFVPVQDAGRPAAPLHSLPAPFEETASPRRIVWAGTVGGSVPFEFPLPDRAGAWSLRFSLATTPEVAVRLERAETYLRNDLLAESAWIAVTDQFSQSILVLDPEVKDWNSPEAVKWSWRPDTRNG